MSAKRQTVRDLIRRKPGLTSSELLDELGRDRFDAADVIDAAVDWMQRPDDSQPWRFYPRTPS